ncbi:MAG: hypothetical protein EOO07_32085, partial [Chitinophagaceae bacterium]
MTIFPMLITLPQIQNEKEDLHKLFIQVLITHYDINDADFKLLLKSVDETFWKNSPAEALKYFRGIVAFAKFTKENPFFVDHRYTEKQKEDYSQKYSSFIDAVYNDKFSSVLAEFDYTNYSKWALYKAILIVPTRNPSEECLTFINKMLDLWLQNETAGKKGGRYDQMDHHIQYALQDKLGAIIFWNADTIGGHLLNQLLGKFFQKDVLQKAFDKNKVWEFFRSLLTNLIIVTDKQLFEANETIQLEAISNFKKIWVAFESFLAGARVPIFAYLLLLDIEWKNSSMHWKPLEGMHDFFKNAILKYGPGNIGSVFNLLSHIGDKTLLPEGFTWLITALKSSADPKPVLGYKHSVHLMYRLYDNHIASLKANKELLSSYLWMLDEMVTQGSSDAYWIREFLI